MAPGCGMNVTAIPLELRELPRWVVWRWSVNPKTGKPKKPPYCPTDPGRNASNQNPADWSTIEKACSVVEAGKADGIGFVLAPPYVGVDLDHELPEADQAPSCSRSTATASDPSQAPATTLS